MNCWHCETELIWGGDQDEQDDDGNELIVSNLSCPECESFVLVYLNTKIINPIFKVKTNMEKKSEIQKRAN
tara:strand:+ start:858 stop:1070 length:213 start_codon:yes stop_codon:yes gene_type:complete